MHDRIRQILLDDWDPHSASGKPSAHAAYDQYIEPLIDLLKRGATEDDLVKFFHEREKETMCFPSLGTQRLRRPARRLLDLLR